MQKKPLAIKKRNRVRARFFSIFLTVLIVAVVGYLLYLTTSERLPNLHGRESAEVLDFARNHNIDVHFEFIYSNEMPPTRVISQSVPPRTEITEGMSLTVEISKGVEVR